MNVVSLSELKYRKYAKVVGDLSLKNDTANKPVKLNGTDYIQAYIKLLTNSIK